MKIFFASHSSGLAGAEQSLLHLVGEAERRGHRGKIAIPTSGPLEDRLWDTSKSFDVLVLPSRLWMGRRFSRLVGGIRLLQSLADVPGYLRHLHPEKYDVVVVNSSVSPVPLVSAFLSRLPVLLIVRESLTSNPMLRSALPKRLIKWLLSKWSTEVICISDYVAGQYSYPSRVVYPQVAEEFFGKVRQDAEIGSHPPQAIMCGTISPEKGQLDAVKAIRHARNLGTDVHLDIYGHGRQRDVTELQSAIDKLSLGDLVRVMGPTSTVMEAYMRADVALVCSRNEGFGKVTAEAILLGRPVVAYDLGGTSEILAHGGGVAIEPSPDAMGTALHQIFSEPQMLARLEAEASASSIRGKLASSARQVVDRVEALKQGSLDNS